MKRYIQRKDSRYLETVDEVDSADFLDVQSFIKELRRLVREYRYSDSSGQYYSSRRACGGYK